MTRAEILHEVGMLPRMNTIKPGEAYKRVDELIAGLERAAAEDMRKRCVEVCYKLAEEDKVKADTKKDATDRNKFFFGAMTAVLCAGRIKKIKP